MLQLILFWIVVILCTVTFHEAAHGFVAYLRGDRTAQLAGRLTFNPLKHIDPFWTVLLPLILFISTAGHFAIGMAKPVPVNYSNLKRPRLDMILVALAGPLANILLASVLTFFYHLSNFEPLLYAVYFNLGLAVFNLLPIPPLDGSKIVYGILPDRLNYYYAQTERFGFLIVMALYFLGVLWSFVLPGMNFFARFLDVPQIVLGR